MSATHPDSGSRVTVGIASYNGRKHLEVVLPSLARQTLAERLHVVVVDDCSTDGTVEWLAESRPDVEVVAHPRNLGVTRSLNDCLAARQGEFVALLNNDLELAPDCLELLLADLEEHPRAAVASPKLLNYHDRSRLDGAGDVYSFIGGPTRRGHGELDHGQYDRAEDVLGACAAVALYRSAAIADVGELDADFYAYYEDIDWSLRARLAGYICRYVPGAVAYHIAGGTLGDAVNPFTRYHLQRNGIWLIVKDLPALALARHAHQLLAGQLLHLRAALRERSFGVWARAWRDALAGLPEVMRKRRAIQRARRVSVEELERIISASASG